jgi:DNA-binding transcriptional MerR regulator
MAETTVPSEHLSIGEVLATLRDEYPDITISKIRFLESQGLIDPERTPSGYRKFYGPDIARLRWILHQQKEHFLPLKVIKGRLEAAGPDQLPDDVAPDPAPEPPAPEPEGDADAPEAKGSAKTRARASTTKKTAAAAKGATKATAAKAADAPAEDKVPARAPKSGTKTARPAKSRSGSRPAADAPTLDLDDGEPDDLDPIGDGHLTRAELASAAGLTDAELTELEEFGLLEPARSSGDRVLFDDSALQIAQLAAGFAKHGIEARHLRMYRSFAEREATLYGQVIQGVLRQRNPEARARARENLVELAGLGRGMRSAFLRRAVDDLLTD